MAVVSPAADPTEDELDAAENAARLPRQARRTDAMLIGGMALMSLVLGIVVWHFWF